MARIFAYCDSPTAHTGFGRSAQHVLHALHEDGHEIVQLAVNHDPSTEDRIPWKVYSPIFRGEDPYGLRDLPAILSAEKPFDLFWTTFDPEVPWSYIVPGIEPKMNVLGLFAGLRMMNPGFKMLGWFPVDGGPLSTFEVNTLTSPGCFDVPVTMSTHVHDLLAWTLRLRGQAPDMDGIQKRLQVVPHGVDMELYRIASDQQRADAKETLGFPRDCFLIVQPERNQQRKQVWLGLELLEKLRAMLPHEDVRLYQHMDENEETQGSGAGWRLRELAWRYGLKADEVVRWRARRFSEDEMVSTVYAAADVVFSSSSGEGFQYPLWEALACGRRVVAPNDSARKAWLTFAPGVWLYRTAERGMVLRGAYHRRMNHADMDDAARLIRKMVLGKKQFDEVPEASRNWVGRTADVRMVQSWWTRAVQEQVEVLYQERMHQKIVVTRDSTDGPVVGLRAMPGAGDVVLMAPAIQAYRKQVNEDGKKLCIALPGVGEYLMLAQILELGDVYQTQPKIPLRELGDTVMDVSSLWHPIHRAGWSVPSEHRTEVVARFLSVEPEESLHVTLPVDLVKQASAFFQEQFGVHPSQCVVICPESGSPHRVIPGAYVQQLCERILAEGLTPVLTGKQRAPFQRVGVLNLTGQTDLPALLSTLASAAAVISVDSGPMHFAAMLGTPLVACFPTFPADSRLGYYTGAIEALEPGVQEIDGEQWPPGKAPKASPGAWATRITPERIMEALHKLLPSGGLPALAPLGGPKVVTREDFEA